MGTPTASAMAKSLGVTPAGLQWLATAAATGKSRQRGNECTKLEAQGYATSVRREKHEPHIGLIGWYEWQVTDAGRDVVKRARAMGW